MRTYYIPKKDAKYKVLSCPICKAGEKPKKRYLIPLYHTDGSSTGTYLHVTEGSRLWEKIVAPKNNCINKPILIKY